MGIYISETTIPRLLRARSLASSRSAKVREGVGKLGSIQLLAQELKAVPCHGRIAVAKIVAGHMLAKGLAIASAARLVEHYFDIGEVYRVAIDKRLPAGWPIFTVQTAKALLDDLVPLAAALGEPVSANRYLNALLEITSDGIIRRVCPFNVPVTKIASGNISDLAGLFKPVVGNLPKVDDVLEALDFIGPLHVTAEDKGRIFGQIFAHRNTETFIGIIGLFTARHNYFGEDKLSLYAAARSEYQRGCSPDETLSDDGSDGYTGPRWFDGSGDF
jgi:hypothetical protein